MKSILITGCNRGLGLGLVRNLLKRQNPPKFVITTCRDLDKAQELKELQEKHNNVYILNLDVKNFDSFSDFSAKVSEIVKDDGLNVLVNNAGVSPKYTRIHYVKPEHMIETFTTNTVAPVILTKAILPLLKKSSEKNQDLPLGSQRAAVINMSSILGSIGSNKDGGLYPYKCSKAALNMASTSMSQDLKSDNIVVTAMHPGWVRTDMGGTKAPMDVDTSTNAIIDFIYGLNETHNGKFFQWNGEELPW